MIIKSHMTFLPFCFRPSYKKIRWIHKPFGLRPAVVWNLLYCLWFPKAGLGTTSAATVYYTENTGNIWTSLSEGGSDLDLGATGYFWMNYADLSYGYREL